ncbi:MAG: Ig domain-containing protein [Verrucomicrobiota bacterium]|jgi:hypothetical protein
MIKKFFWIALLTFGWQAAWGFSLLGPVANGGDAWQVTLIGYNPLGVSAAPPFFIDGALTGPKNLGEGYRRDIPVLYYACDANFIDYFGSNGVAAVQQAFAILNNLTNVDRYSSGLTEFPLNSQSVNYQASALGLADLKSTVLAEMMEQVGLADAVRYTWALHDRYVPSGAVCTPPGPGDGLEYLVIQRNFDITASPLDQLQYSAYVNGELYTYYIDENCGETLASPPDADALELPVDPLNNNPPVASGFGEDALPTGYFYTGLTRDDLAGLRYLISTNNIVTEATATGSLLEDTNLSAPQLLTTSNLFTFAMATSPTTNNPATLQALYPGLVITSVSNYFALVVTTNVVIYQTNFPGSPAGIESTVVAKSYTTNAEEFFDYTFGNVVTNTVSTKTSATLQTITVAPANGSPLGSPNVTTITTKKIVLTNYPSGDFYLFPSNTCGYDFEQTLQTNVMVITNTILSATNGTLFYAQNLITYFTNHVFVVAPCTLATNSPGLYQGIGRMQFVQESYDSLLGQFIEPITNSYTMVMVTNSQLVTQTFQRIVTAPDFIYSAADLASGPAAIPTDVGFSRPTPNFNQSQILPGLAGPGIIDVGISNVITFNKVGPVYVNESPSSLTLASGSLAFLWGSFDGTTNAPVVYPNGTSIANLESEVLFQVSPSALPDGTNAVPYNVTLTVTGGQSPYTWSLASSSAGLPAGLTLSSTGVISGTPSQTGTFDDIVVQLTDYSGRIVDTVYSITIN